MRCAGEDIAGIEVIAGLAGLIATRLGIYTECAGWLGCANLV
jgi:hypothetical protein